MGVMQRREFLLGTTLVSGFVHKEPDTIHVEVMEVFSASTGPSALLVHHADEATREVFAHWLHSNSGRKVVCTLTNKMRIDAQIFRVSLCFGRGLILLREPAPVRPKDVLGIT